MPGLSGNSKNPVRHAGHTQSRNRQELASLQKTRKQMRESINMDLLLALISNLKSFILLCFIFFPYFF